MTTLLELWDYGSSIKLTGDGEAISIEANFDKAWGEEREVSFELTKEKARLLIESIQSYFQIT